MASLRVTLIPVLKDNYAYLLEDDSTGMVAVVDPGEADPVAAKLEAKGGRLDWILNTHHHGDHFGGNHELAKRYGASIVGPAAEAARIPDLDRGVAEGDHVMVGAARGSVLEVPGHTAGHIAFWFEDAGVLFCGDTLFALGCGRLLEGTADQMWSSLLKLRALPDTTRIYCGHEYTQSNARFALTVDGANPVLQSYAEDVDDARESGAATIPAQLGREKLANPFLRADKPDLQAAIGMAGADPVAVFAEIRGRKDRF
ncbi:hydroxyacylglutathione hydrolase [Inquilinus sp. NPDC058860]|uniref:hydroxyacylglutathione hydrolase n=1 Tax=Inquilinus sp. NPDC058860 TaxID=3346652 RepID=UPI00367F4836